MNVLNRNMFRNRDSRNRLAQMGGILSSSPELQETAMTFANGGGADLDTKFILTNIPELGIREGQFVKISAKTLEGLNNAIPEVMARHGDKVKSVELMMDERNSALVALAREGDALIGTRVNRLLEQRAADSAAAPDLAPVPIPPETAQISSPSTQANLASINGVDIETVRRIRDSDAKRSEAALIESLAPNNAQGQPGGILGAKYPEGRGSYSTSIAEALLNSDPFSGELSPSQIARNQETLRNTLRREEIAQQRADSIEAGRIMRDAADTREAFSVPLESGIAKAVVPKSVLSGEQNAVLNALDEFSLPSKSERVVPTSEAVVPESVLSSEQLAVLNAIDKFSLPSSTKQVVKSPAEELIGVSGPLPEAFTGTETGNRTADAANAIAALTGTAKPEDGESSVLNSVLETVKKIAPDEFGFQRRQRERRELAEDKRFDQTGPAAKPSTDELLEVASSILSDEQKEAIASGKISDRAKALLPEQELFSEAPIAGTGQAGLAQKIRDGSLSPEELKAALDSGAGDLTLEAAERIDPEITGAVSFDPKIVPSALLGEEGKARRLKNIQDRLDKQTLDTFTEIQRALPAKSGTAADEDQKLAEEQVVETEAALLEEIKRTSGPIDDPETKIPQVPKVPETVPETVTEKITTLGEKSGMGKNFGGDGSIADLTKDYTKLLKSLLGESDEDKAARKGELFMLMGAALMSGKSSNALTNIGNAIQIGAKAAIQDRVTRKKRDDTIGLKGFELAADRIAKREATEATIAAEGRAFKRDKLLLVERLKNAKDLAEFNSALGKTYIKSGPYKSLLSEYKQARETFDDLGSDISKEDRELGFANYFTKRMLQSGYDPLDIQTFNLYQGRSSLPTGTDGGGQSLDDIT
jgi:hypothetical protein